MRDQHPRGLPHGLRDGIPVERDERAQVENLDVATLLRQLSGRLERQVHGTAVGDDREVVARAAPARPAERHGEAGWHVGSRRARVVEELGLQVDRDPTRANSRPQQACGVVGEGGHHDPDSGKGGEPALGVLRVVEAATDVAARSESDGDVGRELSVGAPVLVRHLDHLLGRRPEVVGELRALDSALPPVTLAA